MDNRDEWWGKTWPESFDYRTVVLDTFFDVLNDPEHEQVTSRITSLTIKNLQNCVDPELTESDKFKTTLSRLTGLHLYILSERNDASPENSIAYAEPHDFFGEELPSIWLEPTATKLTDLTLYYDDYFGFCPRLDLRGIHFPVLQTLALGNYTFTHDWQLEWILSHSSTLENLYLDDCPIIYHVRSCVELDSEGYIADPTHIPHGGPESIRTYDKRWHEIFELFDKNLVKLRDFRMGHGEWRTMHDDTFEAPQTLRNGIMDDRYMVCDMIWGGVQSILISCRFSTVELDLLSILLKYRRRM
jgi:hypothetical protein